MVVQGFVWRYGDRRNGCKSVTKTHYLGEEVLPAMRLTPQHARTICLGPIMMLKDPLCQIDFILKCQDRRQKCRPSVCFRHVQIGMHADRAPDAGRISLYASCVPADLVSRQALIDTCVVDREMPGH